MPISASQINAKLQAWSKTSAGKSKINAAISNLRKNGVSKTQAGSTVLTAAQVSELANEFIAVLTNKAGSVSANGGAGSMPASVAAHFSSLSAGAPVELDNGFFSVVISFGEDLSRPSLTDPSTGAPLDEGTPNIVAIFNNGVSAKGSLFGNWVGHPDSSPTWSQRSRPALGFMQAAKSEFEGRYGGEISVQIILGSDYGG